MEIREKIVERLVEWVKTSAANEEAMAKHLKTEQGTSVEEAIRGMWALELDDIVTKFPSIAESANREAKKGFERYQGTERPILPDIDMDIFGTILANLDEVADWKIFVRREKILRGSDQDRELSFEPATQEELMEIISVWSGMTKEEANELRKLVAKGKMDEVEGYREKFIKGGARHGLAEKDVEKTFETIKNTLQNGPFIDMVPVDINPFEGKRVDFSEIPLDREVYPITKDFLQKKRSFAGEQYLGLGEVIAGHRDKIDIKKIEEEISAMPPLDLEDFEEKIKELKKHANKVDFIKINSEAETNTKPDLFNGKYGPREENESNKRPDVLGKEQKPAKFIATGRGRKQ